jgi:protein gp37
MTSKIAWCNESVNPIQDKIKGRSGLGYHCTKVSPGCLHCYAEILNKRFGNSRPYKDIDCEFELIEKALDKVRAYTFPRTIFWQSMGDLFHYFVPTDMIIKCLEIMKAESEHIHIILTKRPQRMVEVFNTWVFDKCDGVAPDNIVLGISVCVQSEVKDIRYLADSICAWRMVSIEPMLESIDIHEWTGWLNWVICGCETGKKHRPMLVSWARKLKNQCVAAGIPFFLKQMWDDKFRGKKFLQRHVRKIMVKKKLPILDGEQWTQIPQWTNKTNNTEAVK